ncbi:MAG: DNA gyrase C-terminal beta-propeller domain-containing protein, partial [Spirochaetota bacterium]
TEDSQVMIITSQGQTIKLEAKKIPQQSRGAMGVRVVDIAKPDFVVGIDRTANEEDEEEKPEAEDESNGEPNGEEQHKT